MVVLPACNHNVFQTKKPKTGKVAIIISVIVICFCHCNYPSFYEGYYWLHV